jgi:hypothetical protein
MAWVEHVTNHPRDDQKRLRLEPPEAPERPPMETQRRILLRRKVPEHLVDGIVQAAAEQANEAARSRRGKKRR